MVVHFDALKFFSINNPAYGLATNGSYINSTTF